MIEFIGSWSRRQADRLVMFYNDVVGAHTTGSYWRKRVAALGRRAVFDRRHSDAELDAVSATQREVLLPMLRARLNGTERVVLDYGCGWGRFTGMLAEATGGLAIGMDPVVDLLALAAHDPHVMYVASSPGVVALATDSVDVAWITLVLCVITDQKTLENTTAELRRVLRPGALLLIAENTSSQPDRRHIRFRSVETYRALFPEFDLQVAGEIADIDQRISVLVGRSP
jgi:SAM-dependent methyltransferase